MDTSNSHIRPLYEHLLHPKYKKTLTFIGLPFKIVPFPQFELQTKYIARVLSGRARLPNDKEMSEWMEYHYRCVCASFWPPNAPCAAYCTPSYAELHTMYCIQSLHSLLLAVHVFTSADWLQSVLLPVQPCSNVNVQVGTCSRLCTHRRHDTC